MGRKIIKPLVLILIFIAAVVVFGISTNRVNEDMTTSMAEASLPIISFSYGETEINELHGYTTEMDILAMRDSITPVDDSRVLPMKISTYGTPVDRIHYEIRSIDGVRLVAEADVDDYDSLDNLVKTDLKIQNLLENEQEYIMKFTLVSGEKNIFYYTRIMQTTECNVGECLSFAEEFSTNTLNYAQGQKFLPTFLDAATGDPTTLSYVDLSCTLGQVMWGDLKGTIYSKPQISFKEINSSYNVILVNYVLSCQEEDKSVVNYNVEEYFRLRLAPQRMYVLNYERRVNQIFSGENNFVMDNGNLLLGIRNGGVEFKSNEEGSIICFVQEGELWCFNRNTHEIQKVFSFRGAEGIDPRENWNQHDIKIVRVDEAGSVDFIVYGYMNRGDHEGQVGTVVYRYDGIGHTIEEEAFIPSDTSYEVLKADVGELMFENDRGDLYLLLQGNIYVLDLETLKVSEAVSGLAADGCAVAKTGKYIGWIEGSRNYSSESLHLMNLKTDEVSEISEGSGKFVKPLGFIGDDFIYGVANSSDVIVDAAGNTTFPMSSLKILNTGEDKTDVLKEYVPRFGKILDIDVEDYTINVALTEDRADTIMNRAADTEATIKEDTLYDPVKETQVVLKIAGKYNAAKIKALSSKSVIQDEDRTVEIKKDAGVKRYYVYARGKVMLATDLLSEAIARANKQMGVVLDSDQQYVWMRARKTYSDAFTDAVPSDTDRNGNAVVKCVSAMLAHEEVSTDVATLLSRGLSVKDIIADNIPGAFPMDVSGCNAESIIFYVSEGSPVLAMTGHDSAVLVTGYTTSNIYYYDPVSGGRKTASFEDADEMFKNGGNRFITYMKR